MNSLRWIAAIATVSLSLPVLATPTLTAYDFNNSPTSGTVYTTFGDTASYAGLYNSGYFGNSAVFGGSGGTALSTTVTAWASTGTGSSLTGGTGTGSGVNTTTTNNGTIQNAVLTAYQTSNGGTGTYSNNGYALAETSRNTNGGNLNHEFSCTSGAGATCTDIVPNHAIDNDGAYETLLFSFSSAVTLSSVTLGFPTIGNGASPSNTDLTVLYCTATGSQAQIAAACAPSTFAGKTYSQLVYNATTNPTGNWAYTDLLNLSSTNDTGTTGLNAKSQYWMIGAYIADLPNQTGNDNNPDYVKIRAITTCTSAVCSVPEPSSMALLGIAGSALWIGRRRRTLRVA